MLSLLTFHIRHMLHFMWKVWFLNAMHELKHSRIETLIPPPPPLSNGSWRRGYAVIFINLHMCESRGGSRGSRSGPFLPLENSNFFNYILVKYPNICLSSPWKLEYPLDLPWINFLDPRMLQWTSRISQVTSHITLNNSWND